MMENNRNSKISIVIPVYNAENFLHKTIESILSQTYSNWEVILVNDGSTDNSLSICEQYAELDKRFIVVNQKNSGPSAARNTGIENCSGEFITFQDSDDLVPSNRLDVLVNAYFECEADWIIGCITTVNGKGKTSVNNLPAKLYSNKSQIINSPQILDHQNFSSPVNKLYKAFIIKNQALRFDTDMRVGEDWEFNVRYLNNVQSLKFISESVYFYQKSNSFLTKQFRKDDFDTRKKLIKTIEWYYKTNGIVYDVSSKYIRLALSCIMRLSHKQNTMSYKARLDFIKKIKKDEDVEEALSAKNNQRPVSEKFNIKVLRVRSPQLIYLISKIYWFAWRIKQF